MTKVIYIPRGGRCRFEDCKEKATHIASGSATSLNPEHHPVPNIYCEKHAYIIADEHTPEYTTDCPNCGCKFGVN